MQSQPFTQFLTSPPPHSGTRKALSVGSARDIVSRCKRVEKHLGVELDAVYKQGGLDELINQLTAQRAKFEFASDDAPGLRDMLTALRHYKAFAEFTIKR